MSKGIYCYIDSYNNEIIYIGKDSNIDKDIRHKAHYHRNRYNDQPINRILQNNPSRYQYKKLWEIDSCTDNHLNQMEIYFINKYNTFKNHNKFNFTSGGDGGQLNNSIRIRKEGFKNEKQNYGLIDQNGDVIVQSCDKHLIQLCYVKMTTENISGREITEYVNQIRKNKISNKLSQNNASKNRKGLNSFGVKNNKTGILYLHVEDNVVYKRGFRFIYQYKYHDKSYKIRYTSLCKVCDKVCSLNFPWVIVDDEKYNLLLELERNQISLQEYKERLMELI